MPEDCEQHEPEHENDEDTEDDERGVLTEAETGFHGWLKQWKEKYDTEQEWIEAAAAADKEMEKYFEENSE